MLKQIILIIFLVLNITHLIAKDDLSQYQSDEAFQYGLKLYNGNDYYRSITEFKRFIYYATDKKKKQEAEFYIGLNYLRGGSFKKSRNILYDIYDNEQHIKSQEAVLRIADSYHLENATYIKQHKSYYFQPMYFVKDHYINSLKILSPNTPEYKEAFSKLILTHMLNFSKFRTYYLLNTIDTKDKKFKEKLQRISLSADKMKDVPQKSRVLAMVLSVIPGMGQIYAGEFKNGLIALSINTLLGFTATYTFLNYSKFLGILIGQYELTFYTGNFMNANLAIEKYNENQKNLYRHQILKMHF